jgi:hypothetical protein
MNPLTNMGMKLCSFKAISGALNLEKIIQCNTAGWEKQS